MGEKSSVVLYGHWASPFVMRAAVALKIKGIEFEYVEEDLQNKSEQLLKYNPVHKKVPVLVHNGQPIAESLIILEYIDETWTNLPHLLPKDPCLRAKHRFWGAYIHPLFDLIMATLKTEGEAQQKALNELLQKLDIAEEGLKDIYQNGAPTFQDGHPGYLDIVFASYFGNPETMEEFFGANLLSQERYPLLNSWATAMSQVPVVKEVTPPAPKLLGLMKMMREKALKPDA